MWSQMTSQVLTLHPPCTSPRVALSDDLTIRDMAEKETTWTSMDHDLVYLLVCVLLVFSWILTVYIRIYIYDHDNLEIRQIVSIIAMTFQHPQFESVIHKRHGMRRKLLQIIFHILWGRIEIKTISAKISVIVGYCLSICTCLFDFMYSYLYIL